MDVGKSTNSNNKSQAISDKRHLNAKSCKKVAVGLSGGVDSSVSAALLLDQGYQVTGVFLTCWDENRPGCQIDQDRKDALDVALQLGIPFVALDFKKEYQEKVIDYFYCEYQAGRTPNPDTMCNREIKFGLFYEWAIRQNKFDYIATGHYARVVEAREFSISNFEFTNKPKTKNQKQTSFDNLNLDIVSNLEIRALDFLVRGKDEKKDQSYFLYQLRPEQLPHILFPIGHLTKDQVRAEAQMRGLKTAKKPDSQGICFIGQINVGDFLRERIEEKVGKVEIQLANSKWQIANGKKKPCAISRKQYSYQTIGQHRGAPFYTIGQKLGREIDQAKVAKLAKKGVLDLDPTQMPPLFVVAKDLETNTLVAGFEMDLLVTEFVVGQVNWLVDFGPHDLGPRTVWVRIRHGGELVEAQIVGNNSILEITTKKPVRAVASGQACVFYSSASADAVVLGGGVIGQ